jgi:enoyl-CoA hydratase
VDSMWKNLLFAVREGVGLVTINRPDKLNALNRETFADLDSVLTEALDRQDVRALVITGAGDKAFVAGADISELAGMSPLEGYQTSREGQRIFARVETFPKPVVAAVNGFALGGGCELAMACHMRVASESAQFGQPEVNLGLIPGYAGTQRLPRLVGRPMALELLLTGERIAAPRALEIGLVNAVVPHGELMDKSMDLARRASARAPLAVRYCIEAVQRGMEMPLDDAAFMEATLFGLCFGTEDMKEGTAAFLEKRKPAFKGR